MFNKQYEQYFIQVRKRDSTITDEIKSGLYYNLFWLNKINKIYIRVMKHSNLKLQPIIETQDIYFFM